MSLTALCISKESCPHYILWYLWVSIILSQNFELLVCQVRLTH